MMSKNKCKNCKDIIAQFYHCDVCSYIKDKERSTCNSSRNLNESYCVINVSSKSIPSVEGSGLTSPVPSALF